MKIRHCLILSLLFLFFINTPAIGQERDWCCLDGEVILLQEAECIERGGQFFHTREEAEKYCQGEQPKLEEGWCCLDGEVFQTSQDECHEHEGYFFRNLEEAEQYCRDEHPHQEIVIVPNVIGLKIDQAEEILVEVGLQIGELEEKTSDSEPGTVI
ncbi:unnamed protein product [marine sediment metagenome]|uniref:PASTA domain-containing protein n=1 Tax=marine sediment metagenome TaxID=412755 RepID=X0ZB10_9ZZZZ